MATAEEKRTITKKRLQELRNMCREHYNVLIEEGTMPDAADVRVTNQKLEELMELLDGKIKWDKRLTSSYPGLADAFLGFQSLF